MTDENPIVINDIKLHTFLAYIETSGKDLDLKRLTKEFPLDVYMNKEKTQILQGHCDHGYQDDIAVTNSNTGSHVIDQAFEICSKRSKNKKLDNENDNETYISQGFRRIAYPKNPDTMIYIRPPEMIPIGCYCDSCQNSGPFSHNPKCPRPKKTSLYLTLEGFVDTVFLGKYSIEEESELVESAEELISLIDTIAESKSKNKKSKKKRYLLTNYLIYLRNLILLYLTLFLQKEPRMD
jgi:hypothetical protein